MASDQPALYSSILSNPASVKSFEYFYHVNNFLKKGDASHLRGLIAADKALQEMKDFGDFYQAEADNIPENPVSTGKSVYADEVGGVSDEWSSDADDTAGYQTYDHSAGPNQQGEYIEGFDDDTLRYQDQGIEDEGNLDLDEIPFAARTPVNHFTLG